ncbi:serine/threonine-protein kinase mos-like [Antedon mediterranea]|uniref:serine/threonine-protein kinase mos-like n=1 Tax=Antedon mediterranea TaxID=105859 RepID=UPI003AF98603
MTKLFESILAQLNRQVALLKLNIIIIQDKLEMQMYCNKNNANTQIASLVKGSSTKHNKRTKILRKALYLCVEFTNVCHTIEIMSPRRSLKRQAGFELVPCAFSQTLAVEPGRPTTSQHLDSVNGNNNNNNCCQQQRMVNEDDFSLDKLAHLGSGGFGSVFKGTYCGRNVAIKYMHESKRKSRALVQSFEAELEAVNLVHENIVRILAASDPTDVQVGCFLIMEYAGDRNLLQCINDPTERFPLQRRAKYAFDIVSALEYIHSNCLAHLDIKPANVIISPNDSCKITDFGCCRQVKNGVVINGITDRSYLTGTYTYRAPELLRGSLPTVKADMYSLGITLWHMMVREQPYDGDMHVVIFAVVAYGLRPECPDNVNLNEQWFVNLFKQCWHASPSERPSANVVKETLFCKLIRCV